MTFKNNLALFKKIKHSHTLIPNNYNFHIYPRAVVLKSGVSRPAPLGSPGSRLEIQTPSLTPDLVNLKLWGMRPSNSCSIPPGDFQHMLKFANHCPRKMPALVCTRIYSNTHGSTVSFIAKYKENKQPNCPLTGEWINCDSICIYFV